MRKGLIWFALKLFNGEKILDIYKVMNFVLKNTNNVLKVLNLYAFVLQLKTSA